MRCLLAFVVASQLAGCFQLKTDRSPAPPPTVLPTALPAPAPSSPAGGTPPPSATPPRDALPVYQPRMLLSAGAGGAGLVSPDGLWVPFWAAGEAQAAGETYHPAFLNVETFDACTHEDIVATAALIEGRDLFGVVWGADGQAVMGVGEQWYRGEPCGSLEPVESPESLFDVSYPSPDGRYRADTIWRSADARAGVTLVEAAAGRAVVTTSWSDAEQVDLAGRWLDEERFLLSAAAEQGPLILDTGGNSVDVLHEFFGLGALPADPAQWRVWGAVEQATGSLHLLLENVEEDGPLLLYHGESGDVEPLPFAATWELSQGAVSHRGFSPDGGFLLLTRPFGVDSDLWSRPVWLRPVDGERADVFAVPGWSSAMPPGRQDIVASRIVLEGAGSVSVTVLTFPGGEVLQRWHVPGVGLYPVVWSPDGEKLLLSDGWSGTSGTTFYLADVANPPQP